MQSVQKSEIEHFLMEDGVGLGGSAYWHSLPHRSVKAELRIKSPLRLAGLPWFCAVFTQLTPEWGATLKKLEEFEGQDFSAGTVLALPDSLPWSAAITGERVALNLLHRASAIATTTRELVKILGPGFKLMDTRKTTPGLRELEKYAVRVGGGFNHRFTQTDTWMVKDNHKHLMGLGGAIAFFQKLGQPYKNLVVEIHSIDELKEARAQGVRHFMLDNFTPEQVKEACLQKNIGEFYEVSGGINADTIARYRIAGVDALSCGMITQNPAAVDISFKFFPEPI